MIIKSKKLKELEDKTFELEARVELLELYLNQLMLSQGMAMELDAKKWYTN